jgi:hypothetical protein
MARTNENLTQKEIDVFQKFCGEHKIVCDETEAGLANGNLIGEYIAITWAEDITPERLAVALEKLRDRITFYTPAEAEYKKIADEDATRANALNNWFESPSNTALVRDREEALRNQTVLLAELRGREITPKTIQDAIGRASFKLGLHYVPTPRSVDPRQHATSGSFMPKSEANLSAREHAARAKEASAGARISTTPATDYRALSEGVRGATHSRSEQIQKMYVMKPGTSVVDWEQTYAQRRRMAGLS